MPTFYLIYIYSCWPCGSGATLHQKHNLQSGNILKIKINFKRCDESDSLTPSRPTPCPLLLWVACGAYDEYTMKAECGEFAIYYAHCHRSNSDSGSGFSAGFSCFRFALPFLIKLKQYFTHSLAHTHTHTYPDKASHFHRRISACKNCSWSIYAKFMLIYFTITP